MAIQTIQQNKFIPKASDSFTMSETYILRRGHPRRIAVDLAALPWVVLALWRNDWVSAIVIVVLGGTLSLLAVRGIDPVKMADTTLGKIALMHLHPWNLALQTVGLFPLVYGLWIHSTEYILAGLSLIVLGHMWGWEKVDPRLELT